MWISRKEYNNLLDRISAVEVKSMNNYSEIKQLLVDDKKLKFWQNLGVNNATDTLTPVLTAKHFRLLCEALGYEYHVTPEKEEFVKKGRKHVD